MIMIILKEMANVDIRKNNIPRFQIDLFWRIYALYPQSVKRSFDKMGQTLKNWKVVLSFRRGDLLEMPGHRPQ